MDDARRLFGGMSTQFVGVGVSGYMRVVPAFFIDGYRLLTVRDSRDLRLLEKLAPVFCLSRELGESGLARLEEMNTPSFLSLPAVQHHLKRLGDNICLIVFKSYPRLETLAQQFGWRIVANPADVRESVEDKRNFRDILSNLALPVISGESIFLSELDVSAFHRFQRLYGKRLVFQLPEITQGGGRGTFRVDGDDPFFSFLDAVKGGVYRGKKITTVNLVKFMEGVPCSVAACITRRGVLFSPLQTQLMDVPDVLNTRQGWGVFCGHSWGGSTFSPRLNGEARRITLRLAEYLKDLGYRGIFGIDFIAEEEQGTLYPVECNGRYTGAFPMLSLLHLKNGLIPMDVFHVLEFLDVDYEIDVDRLNVKYETTMIGSHILLFNKYDTTLTVNGDLKPGVYGFDPAGNSIRYKREGLGYQDMTNDREFMVTDGVPSAGDVIDSKDEFTRICRILFPFAIADHANRLDRRALSIIRRVYEMLDPRSL